MSEKLPSLPGGFRVGVIGMGKAGPSLASALRANGHQVVAVNARSEESRERASVMLPGVPQMTAKQVADRAELVILAVPDGQIRSVAESLAEHWHPGQVVVHLSGATSLDVLRAAGEAGAITMSLHPAMTFGGVSLDVTRLVGCPIAVTASPLAYPLASAIVSEIGGIPFPLADQNKTRYHAGLVHASNHLVTVVSQAMGLLEEAGVEAPAEFLTPLVNAAVQRTLADGMGALTGPVERGDEATVAKHLNVLGDTLVGNTYRCLSEATRAQLDQYRQNSATSEEQQ